MDELREFGLSIRESDDPNRQRIDFSIEDTEDNVAWVWGDNVNDLDWECNHPTECLEYDDDETVGTCALCGSFFDWHKEDTGEGNLERVPHEFYPRRDVGGIIKKVIKEMSDHA